MAEYDKLLDSVKRFVENELRVNEFVNGNDSGFYSTDGEPAKQVETIPHMVEKFSERYHTIRFLGDWAPETAYAQNDVVREPGSESFWVAPDPFTSGAAFGDDVTARKLIPYQSELIPSDTNLRVLWVAETDVEDGDEITLPASYYPGRNDLQVYYAGLMCVPRNAITFSDPDGRFYQYTEVGSDQNVPSQRIVLHFGLKAGDCLDLSVLSTAIARDINRLETMVGEVEGHATSAQASAEWRPKRRRTRREPWT